MFANKARNCLARCFKRLSQARQFASSSSNKKQQQQQILVAALTASATLFAANYLFKNATSHQDELQLAHAEEKSATHAVLPGQLKQGLPEFTRHEIAQHKSKEQRIWVTFKHGVYDVTEFIAEHPGGDKILLAAGSSIDPFWNLYQVHMKQETYAILEKHRIGNLAKIDRDKEAALQQSATPANDPYGNDPQRLPIFTVHTNKPFNAETPVALLNHEFVTPTDLFYVRNHLPVPEVQDAKAYKLTIQGKGINKPLQLSIQDLKSKFEQHTITATVQCAGNRRSEMGKAKAVKGLDWTVGAIGNAEWKGVKLRDVLKHAGLTDDAIDKMNIQHVQFEGLDKDPTQACYGASIPIEKAMNPYGDVLIVYEMNGKELTRDHGYPLRVIVPGVVAARMVKWLDKIVVAEEESQSFWQQKDYRGLSPATEFANADYSKVPSIQEMPVQSAICEPQNEITVRAEKNEEFVHVPVKGYAWSGGGRGIVRVDVSVQDGDKLKWVDADLSKPEQRPGRVWSWTQFEAEIALPKNQKQPVTVCSKAVDEAYNVQPESMANIWNIRGVLANAYSCIKVHVKE